MLVVAPHPDDEALGAGGCIAWARQAGLAVSVAVLTMGDGFREDALRYYLRLPLTETEYLHLGYRRQRESLTALARLQVPEASTVFLGYPDGGLSALLGPHWQGNPFRSPTTGAEAVPYWTAQERGAPYTGVALVERLSAIFRAVKPKTVVVPHPWDRHPDHWATAAFAQLAWLKAGRPAVRWLGYLIHWPGWPHRTKLWPLPPKNPPPAWPATAWRVLELPPTLRSAKWQALKAYESQRELIAPFMRALCGPCEWFGTIFAWEAVEGEAPGAIWRLSLAPDGQIAVFPKPGSGAWAVVWRGPKVEREVVALGPMSPLLLSPSAVLAQGTSADWAVGPVLPVVGVREPQDH